MAEKKKHYEEIQLFIVKSSLEDVIRTSGVNENGVDNDGRWEDAWDRT